ncbi:ASTRA complex subunit [Actinomortierella ambigua]|nr:ASTRA complex subunit [Actinomortierella ambigua]
MSSHSPKQDAGGSPPPTPSFIYRGHHAPVHALEFFAGNRLLLSGDEQGWLFVWDLWTRRALLKWRAHGGDYQQRDNDNPPSAVLAVRVLPLNPHHRPRSPSASAPLDKKEEEEDDKGIFPTTDTDPHQQQQQQQHGPTQCLILSHGRDHRIHVWDIRDKLVELGMDADDTTTTTAFSPKPVFTLPVSALNFCKMDVVGVPSFGTNTEGGEEVKHKDEDDEKKKILWPRGTGYRQILVAVPSMMEANKVDVYDVLKPEAVFQGIEASTLSSPSSIGASLGQGGMANGHGAAMAVRLILPQNGTDSTSSSTSSTSHDMAKMRLLVGYEDGSVSLFQEGVDGHATGSRRRTMSLVWTFKGHREPVLSLAVSADQKFAMSCASDNNLIRYTLGSDTQGVPETLRQSLKANGIAEVQIRDDLKIVVLAGWDGKIRIFSYKTLKPLAILTCHRESLYCVALASIVGVMKDEQVAWPQRNRGSGGNEDEINGDDSDSDSGGSGSSDEDVEDQRRRLQQFSRQHWLAAGGKENRISQWQIY